MKILFPKVVCLMLGVACLPAVAVAQSYLPLPETSAPVYRPVSSYYAQDGATGSSLINHVGEPPMAEAEADADAIPSPSDNEVAMPSPAMSYGKSVMKGGCGKGCGSHGCLRGLYGGHGCWYGGARVLWLDREEGDNVYLSVFDTAIDVGLLSTDSASMEWTTGGALTIARYIK